MARSATILVLALCASAALGCVPLADIPAYVTATGNPTTVVSLDLSNDDICEIAEDAFAAMHSLTTLKLNGNKLSQVFEGTFYWALPLQTLDLSNNEISVLGKNQFVHNSALTTINMAGNPLQCTTREVSTTACTCAVGTPTENSTHVICDEGIPRGWYVGEAGQSCDDVCAGYCVADGRKAIKSKSAVQEVANHLGFTCTNNLIYLPVPNGPYITEHFDFCAPRLNVGTDACNDVPPSYLHAQLFCCCGESAADCTLNEKEAQPLRLKAVEA